MSTLCKCGFEDWVANCQDGLTVNAGLAASTEYTWRIIDKFNNEYSGQASTDPQGALIIPQMELPVGLLTQFSGSFTLEVFADENFCERVQLKLAKFYDAAVFEVRSSNGVKDTIGC